MEQAELVMTNSTGGTSDLQKTLSYPDRGDKE